MEQAILAIDQGTSGTKTILFSLDGRELAAGNAQLHSFFPHPGYVEQDAEEIYQNVIESVKHCMASVNEKYAILGMGITNQRETFVLWDHTGKALLPAIVWQDKRSIDLCKQLIDEGHNEMIARLTGLTIDPYFSGTKFRKIIEEYPQLRRQVKKGEIWFGTVDSWLLFKLTKGQVHATDTTNASRTLFCNIHTLQWEPKILALFDANRLQLPTICHSASYFGVTTIEGILPSAIPILAVAGDSHASAFGLGCFSVGNVKATLGTGCSLLMDVGHKPVISRRGLLSTLCHDSTAVHYGLEGIIVSCGSILSWLRDNLGILTDTADSEAIATSVRDNGHVYLVPAFAGLGAPYWRMDAKGSIVGLTFESRKEHIVRAALESIAYQVADVVALLNGQSGFRVNHLMVDGGISHNTFVMQLIADLTCLPVITRGLTDASALGVAMIAALSANVYQDLKDIAAILPQGVKYQPSNEQEQVKEQYIAWKNAVEQV